jgi:membrane protein
MSAPDTPKRASKKTSEETRVDRSRVREAITRNRLKLIARAERAQERSASVRAAMGVVDIDWRAGGSLLAGGLAYRIFLWLLPFGLFTSSIVQIISQGGDESASNLVGDAGMSGAAAEAVGQAAEATSRNVVVLLLLSLVLMYWTAMSVLKALRIASALAWRVDPQRPTSWVRSSAGMLVALIAFPVLHVAVGPLYFRGVGGDLIASLITITATTAIAIVGTSSLPRAAGTTWPSLIPGAVLFAVGVESLRLITALFLTGRLERVQDLYGAAGIGAVFMGFLYVLARLAIAALFVNAELYRGRSGETR